MMVSIIILSKVVPIGILPILSAVGTLLSSTVILWLAPLGSPNKSLDEDEKSVYKKRSRFVLILILIAAAIAFVAQAYKCLFMLSLGVLAVSFLLVLGKIKHKFAL